MKRTVLFFTVLLLFAGCIGRQQRTMTDSNINTIAKSPITGETNIDLTVDKQEPKTVYISVDTVINGYRIKYRVEDNEDFISIYLPHMDTTFVYNDQSLFLDIAYGEEIIIDNEEIRKKDMVAFIPTQDYDRFALTSCFIKYVSEEKVGLLTNVCVPDTDYCYLFDISIDKTGGYTITLNEEFENDCER